jgi:hypothetical protein
MQRINEGDIQIAFFLLKLIFSAVIWRGLEPPNVKLKNITGVNLKKTILYEVK